MLYLKQPPIPYLQGQTETLLWAFKQNKPTVKKYIYKIFPLLLVQLLIIQPY